MAPSVEYRIESFDVSIYIKVPIYRNIEGSDMSEYPGIELSIRMVSSLKAFGFPAVKLCDFMCAHTIISIAHGESCSDLDPTEGTEAFAQSKTFFF